ncbi:hypothetical protein C8Q74DRAFT_1373535 [Fomes fomentarius]|nr:hypothetical protein C8Q74DRAFT_1373462 [Fomes fomentarius]KAI0755791.1 hypothetical protein C8Q74DRAFT_1373535 [Fomes fomentarius]
MISADIGIWGIVLEPGSKRSFTRFRSTLRITGAVLGSDLKDSNARTSVMLTFSASDPTTIVLCNLVPQQVEQAPLNLTLQAAENCTFEVVGPNPVHLFGNYIDELAMITILRSVLDDVLKDKRERESSENLGPTSKKRRHTDEIESDTPNQISESSKNTGKQANSQHRSPESVQDVIWLRHRPGDTSATPVAKGDKVSLRFVVRDSLGVKLFAKSRVMTFIVGKGEVPQGFDQGVVGMLRGEQRKIQVSESCARSDPQLRNVMEPPQAHIIVKVLFDDGVMEVVLIQLELPEDGEPKFSELATFKTIGCS